MGNVYILSDKHSAALLRELGVAVNTGLSFFIIDLHIAQQYVILCLL
jgi:hypothetical protein